MTQRTPQTGETDLPALSARILAVDDTPPNLRLLRGILESRGYTVYEATSGAEAITIANQKVPDLILLDIMMPELNGFEVCRQLKEDRHTQDIPVIFISSLDDVFDKVKAFTAGGVDYVTKPFHAQEVLARVERHLMLRNLQKSLQEQVAELDAFAHTVAHDLKNPLGIVISYADYLVNFFEQIDSEDMLNLLREIQRASRKSVNIVDELMLLAGVRKENVSLVALDMDRIVDQAQSRLKLMIREYDGQITRPHTWPTARGHAAWIEEVWVNYLSNGLKYSGSPPHLELGATPADNNTIRFWVKDNGQPLTSEAKATLFTEFTRLNTIRAKGHGLGLSIVRRIVEKLGGHVGVETIPGEGNTFYFTLPAA